METPTITTASYAYANSSVPIASAAGQMHVRRVQSPNFWDAKDWSAKDEQRLQAKVQDIVQQHTEESSMGRRMVRVVIVDPCEDVPTDVALLYDSKEMFTDKTDQELYFDVAIADILKTHNAARVKLVDKSVKDRTQYLEPARIRDLKMVVVELVKF